MVATTFLYGAFSFVASALADVPSTRFATYRRKHAFIGNTPHHAAAETPRR